MAFTKKPGNPPSGADFSALVKKVNETAQKVGLAPLSATITARIPLWKRYVGSEGPEYDEADESGLRAVVKANAYAVDELKGNFDGYRQFDADRHAIINQRLAALEAQPPGTPFPFAGSS